MRKKYKALEKITCKNRVVEIGGGFLESEINFDIDSAMKLGKCEEIKQKGIPETKDSDNIKEISKLNKKFGALEKKNKELREENKTLRLEIESDEYSELISEFEKENKELKEEIKVLEINNETLKKSQDK